MKTDIHVQKSSFGKDKALNENFNVGEIYRAINYLRNSIKNNSIGVYI